MMRETEDVIRSIGKGLVMKVTIKVTNVKDLLPVMGKTVRVIL